MPLPRPTSPDGGLRLNHSPWLIRLSASDDLSKRLAKEGTPAWQSLYHSDSGVAGICGIFNGGATLAPLAALLGIPRLAPLMAPHASENTYAAVRDATSYDQVDAALTK